MFDDLMPKSETFNLQEFQNLSPLYNGYVHKRRGIEEVETKRRIIDSLVNFGSKKWVTI